MGDQTRIVVAQMARVYLAVVGTAAPADATVALDEDWREVGLFTPDSLGWSTDPSFEEVQSHQSNYPTRTFQTTDAATAEVDLQEWSGPNFQSVYGGGTITEITPALTPKQWKFSPPAVGARTEVAAIIEIIDGAKHYRRVVPRCQQTEGVSQTFERTSESTLPLRLKVLGSDIGDAWYDLTNDQAFAPAA
jgi:hypothetical protein